jgi:hypothetical protein
MMKLEGSGRRQAWWTIKCSTINTTWGQILHVAFPNTQQEC